MQPAGIETLARWREEGEWWMDEPPRELHRFMDELGELHEEQQLLNRTSLAKKKSENLWVRAHRMRDDKVAHACSRAPSALKSGKMVERAPYALLHLLSGYAFGRSSLLAEAIPNYEQCQSYSAVLLADPFSLAGAVDFDKRLREDKIQPLIGATFEMAEGGELVLIARTRRGYRNLSHLITACHLEEPRLYPLCTWERLERYATDLVCLTGGDEGPLNRALIRGDVEHAQKTLERLIYLHGRENVFVEIERSFLPWEISVNRHLLDLAKRLEVVPVAGGPITHELPSHFPAQDMLVCVETLCAIDEVVGRKPLRHPSQPQIIQRPRRSLNSERYLRMPEELLAIYHDCPELVENTQRVAERCDVKVLPKPPTALPAFCDDDAAFLRYLVNKRANVLPRKRERTKRLNWEMDRIGRKFAGHFLVAWDMCNWAREQGIVQSGRGSVVDSAVAYCLGLSRIDAFEHDLHFDRFLPEDGSKRPDIDIDFEARRRDDVRNYLVNKYGKAHVATVGAVGTYGTRGIIREVGKVMGIPQESLGYLVKRLHGSVTPERLEEEIDRKPELRDSGIPRERFRWVFKLADILMEIPRGLRSHSSGVVISKNPIADTVPRTYSGVEGVEIIQWDKRSAKYYFDKFDVLCLRGNDVLADTQQRVRAISSDFDVEALPLENEDVFRAMRAGELIGVPQSASPAMRQAHIRLETKNLEEASIVQAAIRPGVGGAVKLNELIKRKRNNHYEPFHPEMDEILRPTYGIIVFQEQVDMLLQTFGGFTSGEAENIREDIYKKRREDHVKRIHDHVIDRIMAHGDYTCEVAEEVYGMVAQFQGYGFAEGHALAFADISIRSIWCQQNHPAEYFAAILDSQPAGYYGPATLANEARSRGVRILPPNVNRSDLKYRVEAYKSEEWPHLGLPNGGIRVSLKQIGGVSSQVLQRLIETRSHAPFESFFDFVARVRPARDELEQLILCGALDELHSNRRALLWAIPRAIQYAHAFGESPLGVQIPEPRIPEDVHDFNEQERAIHDRRIMDLDVEKHLMAFERERVRAKGVMTAKEAGALPDRTKAIVVGNPIRLRFPPTSSGKRVMFFDLEDESGLLNVTCFNETYLRDGHAVICSKYVTIRGEAQHRDGHVAFLASRVFPYRAQLAEHASEVSLPLTTADFLVS